MYVLTLDRVTPLKLAAFAVAMSEAAWIADWDCPELLFEKVLHRLATRAASLAID
jgi:hypothetical protein